MPHTLDGPSQFPLSSKLAFVGPCDCARKQPAGRLWLDSRQGDRALARPRPSFGQASLVSNGSQCLESGDNRRAIPLPRKGLICPHFGSEAILEPQPQIYRLDSCLEHFTAWLRTKHAERTNVYDDESRRRSRSATTSARIVVQYSRKLLSKNVGHRNDD